MTPPALPSGAIALLAVVWMLVVGAGSLAVVRLLLGLVTAKHDLARKGGKTLGILLVLWGITSVLLYVGWQWHLLH